MGWMDPRQSWTAENNGSVETRDSRATCAVKVIPDSSSLQPNIHTSHEPAGSHLPAAVMFIYHLATGARNTAIVQHYSVLSGSGINLFMMLGAVTLFWGVSGPRCSWCSSQGHMSKAG